MFRRAVALKGLSENVPTSHIQRDLTAHQRSHGRHPCTHSKGLDQYHSHEAYKRYIWPCDMCINEHQLAESRHRCGSMRWCSCSVRTYLGALLLLSCFSRARMRCRLTPSDDIQLCSASRARPGIARTKCSELFLLHAADCVDGGLLCEDEG